MYENCLNQDFKDFKDFQDKRGFLIVGSLSESRIFADFAEDADFRGRVSREHGGNAQAKTLTPTGRRSNSHLNQDLQDF